MSCVTAANFFSLVSFLFFGRGGGSVGKALFIKHGERRCARGPPSAGGIGVGSPAEASGSVSLYRCEKPRGRAFVGTNCSRKLVKKQSA